MNRNYRFSNSSLKNISTLSKPLQEICFDGLEIANKRKVYCPDFSIVRGLTTAEKQFELFKKGRVADENGIWRIEDPSKVVTNCDGKEKISDHQKTDWFGLSLAFDFACWIDGKSNYEDHHMALVATCFFEAASNIGYVIDWGGNYRSISDGSHISLVL